MRKLILSMVMSLDGFIETRDKDISWHIWDDEMQAYMADFLEGCDELLYGRKAYEMMIDYWPEAEKNMDHSKEHRNFASKMNSLNKVVYSRTLNEATWNARIVKENIIDEVIDMKKRGGKNIVLLAGSTLAATLIKHNVIDEYRIIVNPVVLGDGQPLFKERPQAIELVKTESFQCGNVLLIYKAI
ncbi:dihydrofolate reductase family protein [Bacillus sp. JCM 19034]|uniref:dihydrofolate reductase family protein n=1 Tax=Bacillus sp. JCM 19034 TaxID=1481928 RepID=UPI00078551FF|nr:dihydrofolate reductase family protein [Bacillus sp. JCM 19034]